MSKVLEFLSNQYVLFGLKFLIFVLIAFCIFQLVNNIINENLISKKLKEIYEETDKNTKERLEEQEELFQNEGYQEHQPILVKLDDLIIDSGIKRIIKFLNAEILVVFVILIDAIAFLLLQEFVHQLYATVMVLLALSVTPFTILKLMSGKRKKETDDELINFINLIENYSKTSDDIMTIIGRTYPYLEEPLRSATEECYLEGTRTGDITKALDNFSKKINHKKFKTLIRNISICSRYEANYSDVAEDSREMLMEYLAGKRQREAMVKNARIEMIIIMFLSAIMFGFMGSFVGENIFYALQKTFIGTIILYAITIIVITIIVVLILIGKDSD